MDICRSNPYCVREEACVTSDVLGRWEILLSKSTGLYTLFSCPFCGPAQRRRGRLPHSLPEDSQSDTHVVLVLRERRGGEEEGGGRDYIRNQVRLIGRQGENEFCL